MSCLISRPCKSSLEQNQCLRVWVSTWYQHHTHLIASSLCEHCVYVYVCVYVCLCLGWRVSTVSFSIKTFCKSWSWCFSSSSTALPLFSKDMHFCFFITVNNNHTIFIVETLSQYISYMLFIFSVHLRMCTPGNISHSICQAQTSCFSESVQGEFHLVSLMQTREKLKSWEWCWVLSLVTLYLDGPL